VLAEVQVRTIFEEGWSEIDHRIRYPYDMDNLLLSQFLVIFNRLAGSADEMGSFIRFLKRELDVRESKEAEAAAAYEKLTAELQTHIETLSITKKEKDKLEQRVKQLTERAREAPVASEGSLSLLRRALSQVSHVDTDATARWEMVLASSERDMTDEQTRRAAVRLAKRMRDEQEKRKPPK
jgi:hypothetical protein